MDDLHSDCRELLPKRPNYLKRGVVRVAGTENDLELRVVLVKKASEVALQAWF
jgi:hypothetical protein